MSAPIMPPWGANVFFDPPAESYVTLGPNTARPVVAGNPRRVGLGFNLTTNAVASFSISPQITLGQGVTLTSPTFPSWWMSHDQWAAFVSLPWFAISGAGCIVTVWELVLNDWPRAGQRAKGKESAHLPKRLR